MIQQKLKVINCFQLQHWVNILIFNNHHQKLKWYQMILTIWSNRPLFHYFFLILSNQIRSNVPSKCNHASAFCFRDLKIDSTSNPTKGPNTFLITLAIIIGITALAGLAIAIYTLIYMTQTLTTAANTTTCKNCLHSSSSIYFFF